MGKTLQPCNLTPEEQAAAWEEFDGGLLTRDEIEMVNEVMTQYLFYTSDRKGKERDCICTHCDCGRFTVNLEERQDFFRKKHGTETHCPRCGQPVTLIALRKMSTFGRINSDRWQRFTLCRTGKNGALLLLSGYAHRWFCWDELRPTAEVSWKTFTYLLPGKRMQWIRTWEPQCQQVSGQWWWDYQWNPSNTVKEPFNPGFKNWYSSNDGDSFFLNTDAISQSALCYCQVDDWLYKEARVFLDTGDDPVRNVIKYLSAYTRYPAIEMAVKFDLHHAATDLAVDGKKNYRDLNWDARSIHEFLRLSKQEAKVFLKNGGNLALLSAYHKARKYQVTRDMAEFIDVLRTTARIDLAEKLMKCAVEAGCTLRVAGNYASKFPDGIDRILGIWLDYMGMARTLQYDLSRKDVTMPKNLRERHDAASETIRYQRIQIDEQQHREYNERLRKAYAFEYGDMCIVVPGSVEEIIHEGKTLKHCVAGYAARHFDDKLHILFLRHKRKPQTPYITIEISPRKTMRSDVKIRQIHGYKNEGYLNTATYGGKQNQARPEYKYKWFLDVWKAWVKEGSRRDKKGNPILPTEKEKTA